MKIFFSNNTMLANWILWERFHLNFVTALASQMQTKSLKDNTQISKRKAKTKKSLNINKILLNFQNSSQTEAKSATKSRLSNVKRNNSVSTSLSLSDSLSGELANTHRSMNFHHCHAIHCHYVCWPKKNWSSKFLNSINILVVLLSNLTNKLTRAP
jgi:hypothetical protein